MTQDSDFGIQPSNSLQILDLLQCDMVDMQCDVQYDA